MRQRRCQAETGAENAVEFCDLLNRITRFVLGAVCGSMGENSFVGPGRPLLTRAGGGAACARGQNFSLALRAGSGF